MIEKIIPKDEEHWLALRAKDVTSTEVSTLFGISPYSTLFETWHRHKSGLVVKFGENERSTWGNRLESAIAQGISEDNDWRVKPLKEYMRDPDLKIGSSFDFKINSNITDGNGLLEIKNVDALVFKDGWIITEDGLEAPPHIELQIQHQLMVSEFDYAYLGALVGGNRVTLLKRVPDEKVFTAIKKKVEQFWNTIVDNEEPKPDFSRDNDVIKRLYSQSQAGKVFQDFGNKEFGSLIHEYQVLSENRKLIENKLDEIKSKILIKAEDAEKIIGENYSISLGIVKGGSVSYERKDYRMFKPSFKKEKK